jgi:hypothetical protein
MLGLCQLEHFERFVWENLISWVVKTLSQMPMWSRSRARLWYLCPDGGGVFIMYLLHPRLTG